VLRKVHCYTSASFSYLDRVRVWGETLRRHHPDWELWLCLSDVEPEGFIFDVAAEPFDHVVRIGELGIKNLDAWMFEHDIVELCTAVKGKMLCHLLGLGAEKVIYLDPDIAVFSSLKEIEDNLDVYDVVLTPHQLDPDTEPSAIADNELASLKYGIYNLGFLAVANRSEGNRFAAWWRDRLLAYCFDDVPNGLFTDQRWCDHVPAMFERVLVQRNPGYNVASWNLSQRPITITLEGDIRVAGRPLGFFHFTKVTWVGMVMLERYSGGRAELFELIHWYKTRLANNAVNGLPRNWWAFNRYEDGVSIPKKHRTAYRSREDLRRRFPEPFASGPESLQAYFQAEEARDQ
jgi:hypothetical protein